MTHYDVEKKPGPFNTLLQHYRYSRPDHRPVPVIIPLLVVSSLALWAYVLLDPIAAGMARAWPLWLALPSEAITGLGRSGWILCSCAAIMLMAFVASRLTWITEKRQIAVQAIQIAFYVFASVAISGLIANFAKRALGRPRPALWDDHGIFTLNPFMHDSNFESFPSGHATTDGALWAALALLYPPLRWPFLAIGFVLALTRVFVSAHYPSDVIVGFCWGMWFAFMMAVVLARCGIVFSHRDGKLPRLI